MQRVEVSGDDDAESSHHAHSLTSMANPLCDLWQLDGERRVRLLDANDKLVPKQLAAMLLGIHWTLQVLFLSNRKLAYGWVTTPNRAFDMQAPADFAARSGIPGLMNIQSYLQCKLQS